MNCWIWSSVLPGSCLSTLSIVMSPFLSFFKYLLSTLCSLTVNELLVTILLILDLSSTKVPLHDDCCFTELKKVLWSGQTFPLLRSISESWSPFLSASFVNIWNSLMSSNLDHLELVLFQIIWILFICSWVISWNSEAQLCRYG